MPYVAVASSSMAATPVLMPRLPATAAANAATRCSAWPYLPPRLSASSNHFSGTLFQLNQALILIIWDALLSSIYSVGGVQNAAFLSGCVVLFSVCIFFSLIGGFCRASGGNILAKCFLKGQSFFLSVFLCF